MRTKINDMKLDKLIQLCQKEINLYVRLKESNDEGYGQCITCNNFFHYKNADAGHFIPTTTAKYRFELWNIHFQCVSCNHHKSGNLTAYTLWMQKKYGLKFIEEKWEQRKLSFKWFKPDVIELIEKYRLINKELKKTKAL